MQKQPGIFDFVVVDKDGFSTGLTNRSSIIEMMRDEQTAKVNVFVGGILLKTYVRMSWAVKFATFIPSKAVEYVFYTKGSFNRGK